jgi:hypothetical protein
MSPGPASTPRFSPHTLRDTLHTPAHRAFSRLRKSRLLPSIS